MENKKLTPLEKLQALYDVLCDAHNDLCIEHDKLVYVVNDLNKEVAELAEMIDLLMEHNFEPPSQGSN